MTPVLLNHAVTGPQDGPVLLLGPSLSQALPGLLWVLVLGDIGVAVIGTLVAALAVRTRARDLLGPLLALPLLVPVVIGCARASSPLFSAVHATGSPARWLLYVIRSSPRWFPSRARPTPIPTR